MRQLDFTPIARKDRPSQRRVLNASCRFYPERYIEHQAAYQFLAEQSANGETLVSLLVRALLAYDDYRNSPQFQRPFEFQRSQGGDPATMRSLSVRIPRDKYWEHRRAAEILDETTELHGEGMKLIIRALLYYREQQKQVASPRVAERSPRQLALAEPSLVA